jgi:hypothetical protein
LDGSAPAALRVGGHHECQRQRASSATLQEFTAVVARDCCDSGGQGKVVCQLRVSLDDTSRHRSRFHNNVFVAHDLKQPQRPATLLRGAKDVALATLLNIEPREFETVIGRRDSRKSLARR